MIERLLTLGPRGRFVMFALLVLVSLAAISQLPHLKIDRSDERLVGADDPGWPALRQMQKDFGAEQAVIVYLRAKDMWTTARLTAIQKATYALQDAPGIISVKSLLSATNIRDKGSFVDAGPLVDIVPTTAEGLAEIRADARYSPLIRRNYLSDDANATAITIGYAAKPGDPNYELDVYRLIENKIAPLRDHFEVVFQLGWPRLNAEIDRGLVSDMQRLMPLSILVLVTTVTLLLRSLRVVPIPLITASLTILWTLGFMAAVGIPITLLTAILPALIIVVGSVEDVHLTASYLDGIETGAVDLRQRAIAHMARHVGSAILITSFANVFGFASNVITDIPLIREFSIAAAFAMFANFVVTVVAMPLMLHAFGPRVNRLRTADETPRGLIGAVVKVVETLSDRYPVHVVIGIAALVIGFGTQISGLKVNNDPMAYFHTKHPFVTDVQKVHDDLAGLQSFSVTLHASQPGWFKTVDGLRTVAEVQALLNNQHLYDKTLSLADLMALMHQEMHRGDKAFNTVPTTQADYELYLSSLPRSELASFVTENYSVAQITVRHNVADSVKLNAAIDHLQSVLPTVLGERAAFAVVGKNLMVNRAAESLIGGELQSLGLILVVIFALFSFLYTSWLAGLLALIPNVIPIVLNFGVMSSLGVPLNPGTAMVAAIAIGLAVDDTIHLMTRFGTESRLRVDERAAVRATIRGEAVPVLTTSAALALGFAVFGLSNFRIITEFGLLAAGTMVYAAISDLLLMPILLKNLRLATVWDIVALKIDAAVLSRCPLFGGMSPYQVKKLILLSEIVEFPQGQALLTQGEVSSGMFVLLKGNVDVSIVKDGTHLTIDQGHPGDLFGEIGFAGTGVARTATITATAPVTAVRLDATRAQKGLRFYPGIATRLFRNISKVLGARLLDSHQRLLRAAEGK
ncbi:MAG: MMPL family transporter [Gammaproteobacteria bacterium]|nr:MMPL family transporter [Gammaproteobacteria bacterium]